MIFEDNNEEASNDMASAPVYNLPDDLDEKIKYWNMVALSQPKKLEKLEILVDKREVVANKAKRKGIVPQGMREDR